MIKIVIIIFLLSEIYSLKPNLKDNKNNDLLTDEEESSEDIIILHTNDVHCAVSDGIGYDGLMLYKKELEKKYKHVLLVDAGDHIQGDVIGLLSKGKDIIDIMNKVGYDVVTLGNHEFDYGLDNLDNCTKNLKCGYISCNYCYRKNKTSIYEPYVIKEVGNKTIAFIGVITPQTLIKTYLNNIVDEDGNKLYDFLEGNSSQELFERVQNHIDEAKSEGADYVILLNHLGNEGDALNKYTSAELLSHIKDVDVMIDGHTHQVYNLTNKDKNGKEVIMSQTGTKLNNIGVLKIKADNTITSEIISEVPEPNGIEGAVSVKRNNKDRWIDKEMNDFINGLKDSHSDELNEKIGYTDFSLIINGDENKDHHKHLTRSEETTLGNLIADSLRNAGKNDTDIAIISAGTIRDDLLKGNITYLNIISILPYSNDIIVKEISGQDVLDALELSMRFLPEKSPRFAQVSGISFKVNISIPSSVEVDENEVFVQVKGKRRVSNVKIGKEDLVLDKKYKIAFDNYIGNGGDGYSMFEKSEELYSTLIVDNQAVINYIKDTLNGTIPVSYNKTEGRIVIISTEDKDKEDDDSTNPSDDPEKKDKEDDNPTNPSDNPENKDKENGNSSDDHILLLAIIISISVVLLIIIIFIIYIKVNRKKHENDMKTDIENLNSKLNNEME